MKKHHLAFEVNTLASTSKIGHVREAEERLVCFAAFARTLGGAACFGWLGSLLTLENTFIFKGFFHIGCWQWFYSFFSFSFFWDSSKITKSRGDVWVVIRLGMRRQGHRSTCLFLKRSRDEDGGAVKDCVLRKLHRLGFIKLQSMPLSTLPRFNAHPDLTDGLLQRFYRSSVTDRNGLLKERKTKCLFTAPVW